MRGEGLTVDDGWGFIHPQALVAFVATVEDRLVAGRTSRRAEATTAILAAVERRHAPVP